MNTMKEKKFVKVIYKECPMCRQETYLRLTKEQMEQCTKYTCCGGLIQDVLPSLDKFGREFVKMGYCPSCQEILYQSTLKDKSPCFSRSELDDDRIYEFSKAYICLKWIWRKNIMQIMMEKSKNWMKRYNIGHDAKSPVIGAFFI